MALHFSKEEFSIRKTNVLKSMKEQNLNALLMFKQESMYWLTGYDTFGFVFFQSLILRDDGEIILLTRAPDLRQAQNTSNIKDIRIWVDKDDSNPSKYIIFRWKPDGINLKGNDGVLNKNYITDGTYSGMLQTNLPAALDDYYIFSKKTPQDNTTGNLGYIEYRPNTSTYTDTGVESAEAKTASGSLVTLAVKTTIATATALLNKRIYNDAKAFVGICTSINDTDEKILLNDLHDIQEWVDGAVTGKINQCWSRFEQKWTSKLMDDSNIESIPANKDLYVELVTSRSDYKNRSQRPEGVI